MRSETEEIDHLCNLVSGLEYQIETLLELRNAAIEFINDQTYGNRAALADAIKKTAPEPRE